MVSRKILSTKKVPFTVQFADWYLALPGLPGERPLSEGHWQALMAKMEGAAFLHEDVTIKTIAVRGVKFKGNGQHTCWARTIAKLPSDWSSKNLISLVEYECDNAKDAAELYAQWDPIIAGRTYNHKARTYYAALGFGQDHGMRRLNLVSAAMAFEKAGWSERGRMAIKDEDRYKLPPTARKNTELICDLMGCQTANKHMHREPVACAILRTVLIDHENAVMFWERVRDGDMLKKNQPEFILREWLRITAVANGKGGEKSRKASFHEMYSRCIHAWNAYRDGRPVAYLKYYSTAPLPTAD